VHRDEPEISPTRGVKIPAARNSRERFATREEAALLLGAVPECDPDAPTTATTSTTSASCFG
jgi:hypothetical protein